MNAGKVLLDELRSGWLVVQGVLETWMIVRRPHCSPSGSKADRALLQEEVCFLATETKIRGPVSELLGKRLNCSELVA